MKKKMFAILLSALMIIGLIAGCSSGETKPEETEPKDKTIEEVETKTETEVDTEETKSGDAENWPRDIIIGYAGLDESQEHLIPVGNNIEKVAAEKAEELGISIKVIKVDNAGDGTKAVENVDNLLLQGIDVLVEFNNDSAVNSTIYEMCTEANIPIMAVDIPVGDAPFMGADNVMSGVKCGEALGELANENWEGKIDAVLFQDTPKVGEIAQIRMNSIWDGIASKTDYSVEELESMTTRVDFDDDGIKAQQLCADFLSANPDKKNIVIGCMNDIGALGSFAAIQAAGREDDCFIVNHGVSVQTRQNLYDQINSGEQNCWRGGVSYFLERYGEYIVPGCFELIQGKTPDPDSLLMDHIFIDINNIEEWYPQDEWSQ